MNATRLLRDLSKSLSAFLLVALLTAATAFGQTIYVDAATGNDLWDGSSMSIGPAPIGPKATIGGALAASANGATIVVKAGTYPEVVTVTLDVTLQVQTSGINTKALINGLVLNNAQASPNNDITFSGSGTFEVQDQLGVNTEVVITDGVIAAGNSVVSLAAGADLSRSGVAATDGYLASGAFGFAGNHDVTYNGTGTQTAGGEYPGNLGTGTLTLNHAGTLTIGATTTQQFDHNTGNVTFTGGLVETFGGTGITLASAGSASFNSVVASSLDIFDITGTGTVTVSGTTNAAGLVRIGATAVGANPITFAAMNIGGDGTNALRGQNGSTRPLTAGAVTVTNGDLSNNSTATWTLLSADLNAFDLHQVNVGGTIVVTGQVTVGDLPGANPAPIGGEVNRIINAGTLTVGPVVTEIDDTNAADDQNHHYVIRNNSGTLTVGAITQGTLASDDATPAWLPNAAYVGLRNALGATLILNGTSTISGDINNLENSGAGADGIRISNGVTITLNDAAGYGNMTALGDWVGAQGTLVFTYVNGGADAFGLGGTLTQAGGSVTMGPAVVGTGALLGNAFTVGNNLTFQGGFQTWGTAFTVGGVVNIAANNISIDAGAAPNDGTPHGNWGGINVTGTNCAIGTSNLDNESVTLTTAGSYALNDCAIFGFLSAAGSTLTGGGASAALLGVTAANFVSTGNYAIGNTLTAGSGLVNLTGNWTINVGATVNVFQFDNAGVAGPDSDIAGALTVNGTLIFNDDAAGANGQEIRFGSVAIGATAPGITLAHANVGPFVQFSVESSFVGGQFTDASAAALENVFKVFIPSAGSTVSVKPGFTVANFQTEGSGRTVTFTESITVTNDVMLGNDTIQQLGTNSIVMSTAGGQFILDDEAQVINDIVTTGLPQGAIVFNNAGQILTTTAMPTSAPTLTNIVVNTAGAGLAINNDIYFQGTFQLIDGGATIAAGKFVESLNDQAAGGTAGRIYRNTTNEGFTVTGTLQGVWDLVFTGTGVFPPGNGEFFDPANPAQGINDLTVSPDAGATINLPGTAISTLGNFLMDGGAGSTGSSNAVTTIAGTSTFNDFFNVNANFTSTGNVAVNEDVTLGNGVVFTTPAKLDVANNQTIAATGGNSATVALTGNDIDHDVDGMVDDVAGTGNTTVQISGTGVVIDRDAAQSVSPTATESELDNVTLLAGATATILEMERINGNVLVNGGGASLTLTTTADATSAATEGRIAGNVNVLDGGTLSVAANGTGNNVAGTMTVQSGGTLTQRSSLTIGGAVTYGGVGATAAVINQDGFNQTWQAGATLTLSTGANTPSFLPAEGTAVVTDNAGAAVTGNADGTVIPNFTANGSTIDVILVVDRAFSVTAGSNVTAGHEVRLNGKNTATYAAAADGFFAANVAGPGAVRTLGTILQASANVQIDNLIVNSATETRLESNNVTQRTFTFLTLNHQTGSFDQGGQNVIVNGEGTAAVDWTVAAAADHTYQSDGTTADFTVGGIGTVVQSTFTGGAVTVNRLSLGVGAGTGFYHPANGDALVVANWFDFDGDPDFANNASFPGAANTGSLAINDGAQIHIYPSATIDVNASFPGGTAAVDFYFETAGGAIADGVESVARVLPTTFDDLYVNGGSNATLPDNTNYQVNDTFFTGGGNLDVDGDGGNDQTYTVADGGTVNYNSAGFFLNDDRVARGGAATLNYNQIGGTYGVLGEYPAAFNSTQTAINVNDGTFNLFGNPGASSIGALTVGDGDANAAVFNELGVGFTATSATVNGDGTYNGALTVNGPTTISGAMTGGPLDANGPLTTGAGVAVTVNTMVSGSPVVLGGNFNNLTFDGAAVQTATFPANFTIGGIGVPGTLTINNPAGVDANGSIIMGSATPAANFAGFPGTGNQSVLNLTSGVLRMAAGSTITVNHFGSGQQGYTQGTGCVFGNVRKFLSNPAGIAANSANSDRMQYPLCSQTGTMRDYAFTIDNPSIVGVANASVTVRHDVEGQAGAAAMVGTNGLPQQVNGVTIGRYPIDPTFWWTVTPSWTMSANQTYNAELFAYDYPNFSLSCGLTACDINEIYSIDRENGSNNNLWSPSSTSINNYLLGADDVVVVASNAVGDLNVNGSRFTLGLKTIFGAAAVQPTFATTTGNGHTFDLTTLFVGQSGVLTYTSITPADASCVVAGAGTLAGDNLTMTGGAAGTCATTVTVNATDEFGATASATFNVNNYPAPAGSANITLVKNVGDASVSYDLTTLFTGGAPATAFINPTPSANVTVGLVGNTFTINFPAATAGQEVVTVQMNDGASTPSPVATQTFLVTVNPGVAYTAGTFTNVVLTEGATNSQALAGKFTGGTIGAGGYAYAASSDATGVATSAITGTNVVSTAVGPYVIVAGVVTADAAPANVTVSATDDLGASAQGMFTVTVNPKAGNVSGFGPDPASANMTLDFFLGLQALTAKQQMAADFDGDTQTIPYDAAQIFNAWLTAKRELVLNPMAAIAYGDVNVEGLNAVVPVRIDGEASDVVSFSYTAVVDPNFAKVTSVVSAAEGWTIRSVTAEDGTITIAGFGLDEIPADGIVATINLTMLAEGSEFTMAGQGAVNANAASAIGDVIVGELPENFSLLGNYPNPFNPSTTISFDLPATAEVTVQVFDMLGRQVLVLPAQTIQGGAKRSVQLNGSTLASGSYFYRVIAKMDSKTAVENGRMLLVK